MAKNDNGNNNEKVNVSILNDTILEHQKQARTDHMQYLDDMEIINSDIQDRVIERMKAYTPENFTKSDVLKALSHDICTPSDFEALLSPAAGFFFRRYC